MSDSMMLWLLPAAGSLLAALCLFGALHANRRRRLLANLPTCKTTGVFIGLVELSGSAESGAPLISFLAEQPCVHYGWDVRERWSRTVVEHYTDSDGKRKTRTRHESGWTTLADGGEQVPFYLRDDCGVVRVDPAGAKIEPRTILSETCGRGHPLYYGKGPARAISDSDHIRAFTEHAIPLHAPIYVVGAARERQDVVAPEIARDEDAPLFLISTRTEKQVCRGLAWQTALLGILGGLLVAGAWLLHARARPPLTPEYEPASVSGRLSQVLPSGLAAVLPTVLAAGAVYVLAWLLAWMWMAYNNLVDLRQRVRQAWANVDVQLKRRADLLPQLVRTVQGLAVHEREVQALLARLRTQQAATPPGQPGPDPAGLAPHLRALAELYPELTADAAFERLRQNLTDTEQRIALARAYFNDIATFYNTRLEILPDRYVAALAGLRPASLLVATDFERAPLHVELAAS